MDAINYLQRVQDGTANRYDTVFEHWFPRWTQWEKIGWHRIRIQPQQAQMPRVQPLATGPRFGNQHFTNHNQITQHRQMDFMRARSMGITNPTSTHNIQPATHYNNSSRLAPLFHTSREDNWDYIWERRRTFNDNRRRWLLLPLPLRRNRIRPRRRHLPRTLNRNNYQVSLCLITSPFFFIYSNISRLMHCKNQNRFKQCSTFCIWGHYMWEICE